MNEYKINFSWNTEDTVFKICVQEIPETGNYMANHREITRRCPTNLVTGKNKNLNLDSAYLRESGGVDNIEHHSSFNKNLIRRNMEYAVTLHRNIGRYVYPNVFYTGEERIPEVEYLNEKTPLILNVKYSKDINSSIVLNNIKYKTLNNELIDNYELLDFIWLPKSSFGISVEEMVIEMINTSQNINLSKDLKYPLNQILYLWADKYLINDDFKKYKEMIDMSSMELPSFRETAFQSKMARMRRIGFNQGKSEGFNLGKSEGFDLGKSEGFNLGKSEGFDQGQEVIVKNLLKHFDAEKVSVITGLKLSQVMEIENKK